MSTLLTSDHPECLEDEVFLGNFTPEGAKKIHWHTKSSGCWALWEYDAAIDVLRPSKDQHGLTPYFADRSEIEAAGITLQQWQHLNLPVSRTSALIQILCNRISVCLAHL